MRVSGKAWIDKSKRNPDGPIRILNNPQNKPVEAIPDEELQVAVDLFTYDRLRQGTTWDTVIFGKAARRLYEYYKSGRIKPGDSIWIDTGEHASRKSSDGKRFNVILDPVLLF